MKWFRRNGALVILGLAAATGVIAAGSGIFRALHAISLLASLGNRGASAQAMIAERMEDSRRAVAEVTETKDPRQVRRLAEVSRSQDAEIARAVDFLVELVPSSDISTHRSDFEDQWRLYIVSRERVLLLALAGRQPESRTVELAEVTTVFNSAREKMELLRGDLSRIAGEQQATISTVLWQMLAELLVLGSCAVLFIVALRWSYRRQQQFSTFRQRNEELAKAEQLERERGVILEMTGRNEPLPGILAVLVRLIEKQLPGSCACLTALHNERAIEVVAPSLSSEFLDALREADSPSRVAQQHGFAGQWSESVLTSSGQAIGIVDVFFIKEAAVKESQRAVLSSAAKLAGIAIQHRHLYEQMAFQAQMDPLTELPNRRLFEERLEQALSAAQRKRKRVAVLLIDLDRFKRVNDLQGHRVGDGVLRTVARRVSSFLTPGDTLARIGGDEFTVILESPVSIEAAESLLRRIAKDLQRPIQVLEQSVTVSVSIGLSIFPDHGEDAATLVRNADLAMYHAKGRGKNGWQTYMPELGAVMLRRMAIEKNLESALENGEMLLHYQIQTDLNGAVTGVEALLRWTSSALGNIPPDTFIPVAEESGLVVPIGAWVLEHACRQAAMWLRDGCHVGRMAVNISARQLAQEDFTSLVLHTLEMTGLPPQHLELELTETALMHNVEDCLEHLSTLRAVGVSVAIDDFGTGYSSLGSLQRVPADRVKIDQTFIAGIADESRGTLPLVRAIVDLAHNLELTVVAEGVETVEQFEILRATGCDAAQGFWLHRPAAPADVEIFLRRQTAGLAHLSRAVSEVPVTQVVSKR